MRKIQSQRILLGKERIHKFKFFIITRLLLCFRPLNEDENRAKTPVTISCDEQRREVSVIQNLAHKQIDETFVFDRVGTWFRF